MMCNIGPKCENNGGDAKSNNAKSRTGDDANANDQGKAFNNFKCVTTGVINK
jgi:hypothetical protein